MSHASRSSSRGSSAKPPTEKAFLKRRTFQQGKALADDAHAATWRLYCEVLGFWKSCRSRLCKRHRRCCGEPAACLMRGLVLTPPAARDAAQKAVIAGGPRKLRPATHMEYVVRRQPLPLLTTWRPGSAPDPGRAGGAPSPHPPARTPTE